MASDSDYETGKEDEESPVGMVLRRTRGGAVCEEGHANSSGRTSNGARSILPARGLVPTERAPKTQLPATRKAIATHLQHLRPRLQAATFDKQLSLRVVHCALKIKDQYLQAKGKGAAIKGGAQVRESVCSQLGISSATYSAIMKAHFEPSDGRKGRKKAYVSNPSGNFTPKETRIPSTCDMQYRVRDFVRQQRKQRKRVTAKQVLEMLLDDGVLVVPKDGNGHYMKTEYASAYRNTRVWLSRNGYQRGRRKGNNHARAVPRRG